MAGNRNQKIKLLYLIDIFKKYTDEEHPLSANEICDRLLKYGVEVERKSIYDDVDVLIRYGLDIITTRVPKRGYFLGGRDFELAEICLLIDAVKAASFISPKKSSELAHKLGNMLSVSQEKEISARVYVENRGKCTNEEIYYNIDALNKAIVDGKKVTMHYIRRELGENNRISNTIKELTISPYALTWVNDHYYLIGNNSKYDNLIHLRVDRMKSVKIVKEHIRHFSEVSDYKVFFDIADYSRKSFNMFGGETKTIKLCCKNTILEQVVDRFGEKLFIIKDGDSFTFSTKANISDGLVSWLLQFGGDIEVVEPADLRVQLKDRVESIANIYR